MCFNFSAARSKTHYDINLRVGINTGGVLGGVLGKRQWQFEILGKEVIVAHKTNSSGLPG